MEVRTSLAKRINVTARISQRTKMAKAIGKIRRKRTRREKNQAPHPHPPPPPPLPPAVMR